MEQSRGLFAEILDILRRAWTKDTVRHDGEYYRIAGVRVVPKPLQKPHPPIWIGATSAETVKLSAARGIPFMCDRLQTFEQATELVRLWSTAAVDAGHDTTGTELVALRPMRVAGTSREVFNDRPVWVPQALEETRGGPPELV